MSNKEVEQEVAQYDEDVTPPAPRHDDYYVKVEGDNTFWLVTASGRIKILRACDVDQSLPIETVAPDVLEGFFVLDLFV